MRVKILSILLVVSCFSIAEALPAQNSSTVATGTLERVVLEKPVELQKNVPIEELYKIEKQKNYKKDYLSK